MSCISSQLSSNILRMTFSRLWKLSRGKNHQLIAFTSYVFHVLSSTPSRLKFQLLFLEKTLSFSLINIPPFERGQDAVQPIKLNQLIVEFRGKKRSFYLNMCLLTPKFRQTTALIPSVILTSHCSLFSNSERRGDGNKHKVLFLFKRNLRTPLSCRIIPSWVSVFHNKCLLWVNFKSYIYCFSIDNIEILNSSTNSEL